MPARDIRRPGHRGLRGFYPSHKTGRTLAFESRLERDHFLLLDADPDVVAFDEQPVTIAFEAHGQRRRYTPDCHVVRHSRPAELVEVKYAGDLAAMDPRERARLDEAHNAARAWCAARGWTFALRTDRDVVGPLLDRAMALHAFARAPTRETVVPDALLAFVAKHPGVSLAELARAFLGRDAAVVRHLALHLVWRGRLRDDPFAVPTEATQLFAPEFAS